MLQKRAVRIVNKRGYLTHSDPLFKRLKLSDLYEYCCALFVYKFKNNYLPFVCAPLLSINTRSENDKSYNLRLVSDFNVPLARTSIRERCITVRSSKIWINLEDDIKYSASIGVLKNKLRKFYIDKY